MEEEARNILRDIAVQLVDRIHADVPNAQVKVTDAELTFVAIDDSGKPRAFGEAAPAR